MSLRREVREAADLIIGNLNEDGYLIASDDELMGIAPPAPPEADAATAKNIVSEAQALGLADVATESATEANSRNVEIHSTLSPRLNRRRESCRDSGEAEAAVAPAASRAQKRLSRRAPEIPPLRLPPRRTSARPTAPTYQPKFTAADLQEALEVVRQLDPPGVACRDLRECLLCQLRYHQAQLELHKNGNGTAQILQDAIAVVDQHLRGLQNKQHKEIGKAIGRPMEAVQAALDYIRTLDPRPGLRYNKVMPRLIEPDVAFVKHGDEWLVIMNDEDLPQLRLNPAYKKLVTRDGTNEKSTRDYVKERYKSAIQLIKNIEQRKQTITKVCYCIVARQQDFLERGIDQLKPMMIKEVAEEIGVHPSTVSRAVASKYAHTPQGVFELRYFFSESVQGPEGGGTSLLILKRRVKKLIEEEDPSRPLTDEQITRILQSQGIQVTRRTVAKYREDMRIPSTHQRRVKK